MKTGIELITEERKRQIEEEGWSKEHDQQHVNGEIALAAALYSLPEGKREYPSTYPTSSFAKAPLQWPWDRKWWKPTHHNRVRELVKAGALIAAEIDRLQNNQSNE